MGISLLAWRCRIGRFRRPCSLRKCKTRSGMRSYRWPLLTLRVLMFFMLCIVIGCHSRIHNHMSPSQANRLQNVCKVYLLTSPQSLRERNHLWCASLHSSVTRACSGDIELNPGPKKGPSPLTNRGRKEQMRQNARLRKEEKSRSDTCSGDKSRKRPFDCSDGTESLLEYDSNLPKKKIKRGKKGKVECKNIIDLAGEDFIRCIKEGPVHVCTCCKRLLYRHSVVVARRIKERQCFSGYFSCDGVEYICNTCNRAVRSGRTPAQAEANNLYFEDVPAELADLCALEIHLLALRLPFMKIMNLPRGAQKGIRGPVINVPAKLDAVIETLPRLPSNSGFVPVKLKKKLEYTGHSFYQCIRPGSVQSGLKFLKENNCFYESINFNGTWLEDSFAEGPEITTALVDHIFDTVETSEECEHNDGEKEWEKDMCVDKDGLEETTENNRLRGLTYNSCLQPDLAVDASDGLSFAPGEGQHPLSLFTDENCDVMSFPKLFPTGKFGLSAPRTVRLTARKFFNQRLLNVDKRCACDTEFLFYAQYYTEARQICDNITIALRQGSTKGSKAEFTAGNLRNSQAVQDLLSQNHGFRFLQNVRGSFPYWRRALWDLFAMVRTLGIPTFFVTFSAADLRWPETIAIIARQVGVHLTDADIADMDWQERCRWIRTNPVTAARHFQFRFQKFFRVFMKSAAAPVGCIEDFFFRTEFQQRGSPHIHGLLWVKEAPKLGQNTEEEVADFISKYISCALPPEDNELHEYVNLQKHSHSPSCWKKGKVCRYSFPKPPSEVTMIADRKCDDPMSPKSVSSQKYEMQVLKTVQEEMAMDSERTLCSLLAAANLTLADYQAALKKSTQQPTVILKRDPRESCINNYNPHLLKYWRANMDIQYVTNAYACAMYILSYVSKGERQMGLLLKEAARESQETDDIRKQMRHLGNTFLTHREVSAQEAVYRALSMPLQQKSRVVTFVNTSMAEDRVGLLKPAKKLKDLPEGSTDIFEKNILDRYAARPHQLQDLCLADFASNYQTRGQGKIDDKDETMSDQEDCDLQGEGSVEGKKIQLLHGLGMMVKRKLKKILRWPKFSLAKAPEKFYHSLLMLYFPWRKEITDLLADCSLYEDRFKEVQDVVQHNLQQHEHDSDVFDRALQHLSEHGPPENVWDNLAAANEQEYADGQIDGAHKSSEHAGIDPDSLEDKQILPEFADNTFSKFKLNVSISSLLPNTEYHSLVRKLNNSQRNFFEIILMWCRDTAMSRKSGKNIKQFHYFLTGGAGTGKSHLIRTVVNMARRELRTVCKNPEEITVLLVAPTGVAATNIDGNTVHSALSIPVTKRKTDYQRLGSQKLAAMRNLYTNLQIIIIDEISMVGLDLFHYIHRRLNEIMGTKDEKVYFGGVSVLAVGDFYQLEPVSQRSVFSPPVDPYHSLCSTHLWKDLFVCINLTEVMRQKKDGDFAQLLNRVRTAEHTLEDERILESRQILTSDEAYPMGELHVFTTNSAVNTHNEKMVNTMKGPFKTIDAILSGKDVETGLVDGISVSENPNDTGGLRKSLTLAVGAKVMITKNISVADGLVNGTQGVLVGFSDERNFPASLMLRFHDSAIGRPQKVKSGEYKDAVPIFPDEIDVSVGKNHAISVKMKQFPITLCFACTIHKVQGLSLDKIVVSFEGNYRAGQAYVALSRAKTLEGLYMLGSFDAKKIKASDRVQQEMARLHQNMCPDLIEPLSILSSKWFKVCHMNVRGLNAHFLDLAGHTVLQSGDILAITETWLEKKHHSEQFILPGYKMLRQDRMQTQGVKGSGVKGGGLAIYIREDCHFSQMSPICLGGLEVLPVSIQQHKADFLLILVYRPPHVPVDVLNSSLPKLVSVCTSRRTFANVIILGDFNVDWLHNKNCSLDAAMSNLNFRQIITEPTHQSGSCLDHIYVCCAGEQDIVLGGTRAAYYSDHNASYALLPNPGDKRELEDYYKLVNVICHIPGDKSPLKDERQPTVRYTNKTSTSNNIGNKMDDAVTIIEKNDGSPHTTGLKTSQIANRDDDISVTGVDHHGIVVNSIDPISRHEQHKVAMHFDVTVKSDPVRNPIPYDHRYYDYIQMLQNHTPAATIDCIEGDGNCFFRAVSKEVLGSEIYHSLLRDRICIFMNQHPITFQNWCIEPIHPHIVRMSQSRQWATETEIVAVATYFGCKIIEFTSSWPVGGGWQWIEVEPARINNLDPEHRFSITGQLYLHHTNGNHFDRIVPV